MDVAVAAEATTVDAFLGGLVEAVQPKRGRHRAGLEAVLLSAAIERSFAGTIVDLGAGVGVAGFAIAARCPGAEVVLVDRDAVAVDCARAALARSANRAFAGRVRAVAADLAALSPGILPAADAVVMNPPFHRQADTPSPSKARAAAHVLADGGLEPWIAAAASLLAPGARLVVIFRADRLDDLRAALSPAFGGAAILPIRPRAAEPAHRVLVRAIRGSSGPAQTLPPLVLHEAASGAYLPAVERILRHGAGLAEVHPAWRD